MAHEPDIAFDGLGGEPRATRSAPPEEPEDNTWRRLRVTFDPRCQAPLLLVTSLIVRRAVEVRSARFDADAADRPTFEATVRGRGQRLRTVELSLQSRVDVLDAMICPVGDDVR